MSSRTPETATSRDAFHPEPQDPQHAVRQEDSHEPETAHHLDRKVGALEADRTHLEQKLLELRSEQQHLLERYVGLEDQISSLTTLYVACQRLHSTLDRPEALLTVREIIANLIGCEEYVLFRRSSDGWLHRVDSFGFGAGVYDKVLLGSGLIGRVAETGVAYLHRESDGTRPSESEANLTACIPLRLNGAVTGVIALFRLLPQKLELQELDRELFWLLETHLAKVLYCTELHESQAAKNGVPA